MSERPKKSIGGRASLNAAPLVSEDVPRVTVVIPNWNGMAHLEECLDSLTRQRFSDFEVVVVDNASTDSSVEWLRGNVPRATVRELQENGGFSVAVNEGIKLARGEYIALLNNDTIADPDWLASLVRQLDGSTYDFAASCMVFFESPNTVNTAGDVYSLSHLMGWQRGYGEPRQDYMKPVRVLGASGGAVMYRRGFFEHVGLYDEDYFLLHEDTDINLRALIIGKRCAYVPDSVVIHKHGASRQRRPADQMASLDLRNQYSVVGKDLPLVLIPWVMLVWLWHIFRATIPLRPSKWHLVPALLRESAHRFSIQREGFRIGWSKRGSVWSRQAIPTRQILRWLFRGVGPL